MCGSSGVLHFCMQDWGQHFQGIQPIRMWLLHCSRASETVAAETIAKL
jgi:hypothetical protein